MIGLLKFVPKPYLMIGVAVVLVVSHVGAMRFGYTNATNAHKARMQADTQAKLVQMQALMAENARLHNEVRTIEADHATTLTAFSKQFQEKIRNVKLEKDNFVAGVRAGTIRLRIPQSATNDHNTANADTEAGTSACGCDAKAGTELPQETAEFLWGEASRADEIVEQLNACQSIVNEDRRLCGK
jgi:prophage endopeptidase